MNVQQVLNVLLNGITEGTIDANTTVYFESDIMAGHGVHEVVTTDIVKIGNGTRVVIS